MREVFAFAQKPYSTATVRGRVNYIDPTICEACVRAEGGEFCIALDPQDCSEALVAIVAHGGDAVQIECDSDTTCRCVQLHVMANEKEVDRLLAVGSLVVEEHLVVLARSVWRDARTFCAPASAPSTREAPSWHPPAAWNGDVPLHAHQQRTVEWVRSMEDRFPMPLTYSGNLQLTETWYIDTESECLTQDASPREAQLEGGIVADGTGTGKTATLLGVIASGSSVAPSMAPADAYASRASLVIVPLNLVSRQMLQALCPQVTVERIHVFGVFHFFRLRG